MVIHHATPTDSIREWAKDASGTPAHQVRAEMRLMAAILTAILIGLAAEPVLYLLLVPDSTVARVARLSPSIYCVAGAFSVSFTAAIPHLFVLVFLPSKLERTWPRVWAGCAAGLAALTWLYLATLALPLDIGPIEWAYLLRVLVAILIGGAFGVSLNAQQIRECACDEQPRERAHDDQAG